MLGRFAQNKVETMHTSTVTQAEILTGIALRPEGQLRTALAAVAEQIFEQDFAGRCPAFDSATAKNHALIVAGRNYLGKPISTEDAQIAAISLATGLTVATPNSKNFGDIDRLTLVNHWKRTRPH